MDIARTNLMNYARALLSALLFGLIISPFTASASDIDIYSGLTSATGAPNVLIVLDNAANFTSSSSALTLCSYNNSSVTPTLGATNGRMEQCALYNVVQNLPTNTDGSARINIGIMVYNATNVASTYGCASGGNGGCLIYPITPMTATNIAALKSFIQNWQMSNIKANGEATGSTMNEAYAYLHGTTSTVVAPSGSTYTSPISSSGCQKTYVVFIANALDTNGTPGDGGSASPGTALANVVSADTALTTTQQAKFTPTTIQVPSGQYGINGVYSCSPNPYVMPNHTQSSGLYADEWSYFMFATDLFTGAMPPNKNITTYAIGVLSSSCRSDYPALLDSMATNGGGNYYAVQSADELANALDAIFNEVQAVNSVFSSATLPVSVNTQGTYLNQIYMGMFRPDPNSKPRWVGNVKQYQFELDTNGNLYLADATRQPALSASGTGFITPEAASFWSCTSTTHVTATPAPYSGPPAPYIPYASLPTCDADPLVGFWRNNVAYYTFSAGGAYDLMDGEIVEKGGVSQQLRLENLTDDYTLASGTGSTVNLSSQTITGNPRRLYTYCPGGAAACACKAATPPHQTTDAAGNTICQSLTDAVNVFGSDNTLLTATAFNSTNTSGIATLTRSGGTVTATTSSAVNWGNGDTVQISGASPSDYNGTFTIQNPTTAGGQTTFTYQITEYPPTPAKGSYMVQVHQPNISVTSITRTSTANGNPSPNVDQETATVTTSTAHGFSSGNPVFITGGGPSESAYNGQQTITVTGSNTFTFPVTITPPAVSVINSHTSSASYTFKLHNTTPITIQTISLSGSKATVTTATAHNFVNNDFIQISNTSATCFQTSGVNITVTGTYTFTYSGVTGCGGGVKSATGGYATPVAPAYTAYTLTRTGTTSQATATATFNVSATQFASGDVLDVTSSGAPANEALYTGTSYSVTCASLACTTLTYTINTNPIYPSVSTGIMAALSSGAVSVAAGGLTRGTTPPADTVATANLTAALPGATFGTPAAVDVYAAPGTVPPGTEAGYQVSNSTANCTTSACTTITYGPIQTSPISPAGGTTITATDTSTPPSAQTLINWVRGQDNMGDESSLCQNGSGTPNCPNPMVTVRPSVHGDALHSRPIAVNYGDKIGVVVFYGTNDGVYHAVNGNQPPCNPTDPLCPTTPPPTTTITDTASGTVVQPGGEIWGFVAPDFYAKLNRQRANSPLLLLPGTITGSGPTPLPKDYFIDGPTGLLQEIDGSTPPKTVRAIIYVGARRGGHLLYAIDVTDPFNPYVLWHINNASPNMSELGQTWSLPKIALVDGYVDASGKPKPVLIMGGGYDDGSEDAEPPVSATPNGAGTDTGSDNSGRAIYVLDALDGHVVWAVSHVTTMAWPWFWERPSITSVTGNNRGVSCAAPDATGAIMCVTVAMNYSIPADVTLMDKDGDGYIDRFYATDTGGNVWRVDLHPSGTATPDQWQLTQLAALGCNWGPCDTELQPSGSSPAAYPVSATTAPTQRKFFFPAEVIGQTSLNNYDAVFVGSGDREHPLASNQAYNVVNRVYMIKDMSTGNDSSGQDYPITEQGYWGSATALDDCTGGTCTTATTGAASALSYDQLTVSEQHSGYYFTLGTGEKVVNAPLTTAGYVYFGTNQPAPPSTTTTCTANLGTARGYQLAPFSAQYKSTIFAGGGLPPSPVSGIVNIQTATGVVAEPFCVGCPSPLTGGTNCAGSALAACKPTINVPAIRRRNYWYLDNK